MNNCKLTPLKVFSIIISLLWAMQAMAAPSTAPAQKATNKNTANKTLVDKKTIHKKSANNKTTDKKAGKNTADKKAGDKKITNKKNENKKTADKKVANKTDKHATKKPTPKNPNKSAKKPTPKQPSNKTEKKSAKKSTDNKPKSAKSYGKKYKQSIKLIPSDHLKKTAKKHGIDPLLVKAIIKVESDGRPNARSPKGAIGLMQVMPATARQYGRYNLKDPKQNITVGVRHFASLKKRYKNTKIALAAYNAGEGNVEKYGGIPPFKETKRYVTNTMATYRAYKANSV